MELTTGVLIGDIMKQILSLYKTNFYMITTNETVFLPYKTDKRFFIYTQVDEDVFVFGHIPRRAYDFLAKCMTDHDRFSLYVSQSKGEPVKYVLVLNHVFNTKRELLLWIKTNVKIKNKYIVADYKTTMIGALPYED